MASFILEGLGWLVVGLFSLYIFQVIRDSRRRLPPGPWPPKPIIGDILDLGEPGQQHRSFQKLSERYGDLMCLRFGSVPHVIVSSPEALRAVFHAGENGKKVDNIAGIPSLDVLTAWNHDAHTIFALPSLDDKWRAVRKFAAAEMLAPRRIAGASSMMQARIVESLYRDLSEHAASGTPVAIRNAVMDPILSLLLGLLYSIDLEPKERAMFRDTIEEIVEILGTGNISDMFPAIAPFDLEGLRRRAKNLLGVVYRPFDEQVVLRRRSREAGEPRKNDVLDTVLDKESEWEKEKSLLSPEVIRVLLSDIYGAGGSSTAALMEWGMVDLIQNPETMRQAKEELKSVLGDKPFIEESDVPKLPYLQAVIKEMLRLRVALPLMPRKTEADIEVNGYRIPKNTNVLVNAWAINRNAQAWPDPHKFIPERFLADGETRSHVGQDFDMIPFGLGRRICPGMPLAMKMIPLILGTLLHRFDWELPAEVKERLESGIDMKEKCGVVLTLVTPLKVIPREI